MVKPFQITISDTIAHFVNQLFILTGVSGGVEGVESRECYGEAAGRTGVGLTREVGRDYPSIMDIGFQ